jgi:hypothetical protein
MSSTSVLVAKRSFSVDINGTPRSVRRGETFRKGHPVVEGREHLFGPFKVDNEIEQATAAPGEKRSTRLGRKSKPETAEPEAPAEAEEDTGGSAETTNYADLKQPELKALLDQRGIEYPAGVVSNADLIALLESKPETAE